VASVFVTVATVGGRPVGTLEQFVRSRIMVCCGKSSNRPTRGWKREACGKRECGGIGEIDGEMKLRKGQREGGRGIAMVNVSL